MASIIIPAHNEERVLAQTLEHVLAGLGPAVGVVVACNGCTDATAAVAQRFAPRVQVLDIEAASKVAALNAAEASNPSFPRVYLDADIPITGSALMQIIQALQEPGALAAEPRARFDLQGASCWVRAYYAVWRGLHGAKPGDIGCGLYALSAAGRARFEVFPQIIADDGFVRAHFRAGEIRLVETAESLVRAPRTLADLVRVKTRSKLGVRELGRRFPELWQAKRASGEGLGQKLAALAPRLWPLLPIYFCLQTWIGLRVRRRERSLETYRWERDHSTHGAAVE